MKHRRLGLGSTRVAALGAARVTAVATITAFARIAAASSHREAPAIALDPAADNTDLWAWVAPTTHDKLYIAASYNPLEEPAGGPNFHRFSDDVLYEIHLARGVKSLADVITYQLKFASTVFSAVKPDDLGAKVGGGKEFFYQLSGQTQTYTLTKLEEGKPAVELAKDVPVAPPNIGPNTNAVVYKDAFKMSGGKYDDAFTNLFIKDLGAEGRVFAGPREDGFYVDLGGIFDLANLRAAGTALDNLASYNCHAVALEIPTRLLTGTGAAPTGKDEELLGIWASASRRKVRVLRADGTEQGFGPWVQVSRIGLPLINEAVIGLQDKDKYNRTRPATDVSNFGAYFLNPVIVRDAEAVKLYEGPLKGFAGDLPKLKTGRVDILDAINLGRKSIDLTSTGDVLRVDMGTDSAFPNGRAIPGGKTLNREQTDVTDALLGLLLTKKLSGVGDGVDYNDANYAVSFPWLTVPWEGFSHGHGEATPPPPP